tara:strand:- start:3020 stop:3241 length:222 start_codon:yes stop_codon:yes gene_type:complete
MADLKDVSALARYFGGYSETSEGMPLRKAITTELAVRIAAGFTAVPDARSTHTIIRDSVDIAEGILKRVQNQS